MSGLARAGLVSAALLSCPMGLHAQTGLPPQPFEVARSNGAFTATLVSTDATRLVVKADGGAVVTFVVDSTSSIPAGLVPGSRVTVRYEVAEGNQYRVASVGIPKIPLEGGSTTEPPPMPPEVPEPTPSAGAEASVRTPGPAGEDDLDAAAPPNGESPAGAAGEGDSAPASASEPPPVRPSHDGTVNTPRPVPPRDASSPEGLQAGREALLIGAGLVFVALALGLLVLMRR